MWGGSDWRRWAPRLVLGVGLACGSGEPSPPSLLLVTLDTTRADHTTPYGAPRDTTPALARLASQGVRVETAYAPTATTGPTHATLFTGRSPLAHGALKNGLPLSDDLPTLAERLSEAGFQTAGVAGSFVLERKFGFARGFDQYDDAFPDAEASLWTESFGEHSVGGGFDRRAHATTERALRFLRETRDPDRPFFLFLHYFDPHDPYRPPAEWADHFPPSAGETPLENARRRYDNEIAYTDMQLGRVLRALDELELTDETLVVVTADHGEGFLEHGHLYHSVQIYEEAVLVPLLARWPGVLPPGRVIGAPVALAELPGALLDLLGVAPGGSSDLARALRGELDLDPERPIFLHREPFATLPGRDWPRGEVFAVRRGRWKYLEGREEDLRELYDLERDPDEKHNLLVDEPAVARELAAQLHGWVEAERRTPAGRVSPDDRERLEALGYVE